MMGARPSPYRYTAHLMVSGALGLVGLLTALGYMLWPHPYTVLLYLAFGQGLIVLSIIVFAYVVVRDVLSRMDGVAERRYEQGEIIFRRGDFGDRLYVINKGEVEVIRSDNDEGEMILARLGPNEYFGEMALLSDAPRNATIRAATDLEVLTIHRDDFASLRSSIPALRQSVEEAMNQRRLNEG
jgi:cyclic nucleotide-binding protein